MPETPINVTDLEDVRDTLRLCLQHLQARDLMNAAIHTSSVRYSPLTNEVARMSERVDGIMGDYLLAQHDEHSDQNGDQARRTSAYLLAYAGGPDDPNEEEPDDDGLGE